MLDPPVWTLEELDAARQVAIEQFRIQRMEEPLEGYLAAYDRYMATAQDLLQATVDLTDLENQALAILSNADLLEAFRFFAGPPISADDLKTLTGSSLSPKQLSKDPNLVRNAVQTVLLGLDRRRFPWVETARQPTPEERSAAVIASAVLLATRRVGTKRRMENKKEQEERLETALLKSGIRKVASRKIDTLADAPASGEFCRESLLGSRKADFVVRLWDNRSIGIECKVSNSATNSVKRLNNDAAVKAEVWKKEFGERQVVPAAVLSGVFKLRNLQYAQSRGLTLFWAHELDSLLSWIAGTINK